MTDKDEGFRQIKMPDGGTIYYLAGGERRYYPPNLLGRALNWLRSIVRP